MIGKGVILEIEETREGLWWQGRQISESSLNTARNCAIAWTVSWQGKKKIKLIFATTTAADQAATILTRPTALTKPP